jgi:hypothetical protein
VVRQRRKKRKTNKKIKQKTNTLNGKWININDEKAHNRGADKSLARPGRKKATATEDFDVHISYLQS